MGDSPDAVAPAAASAKVEDNLGARAAAALASSGASSGAQPAGAASPSGDWATWARQVEAEFARVHKRLDDNYAELSALASSTREAADTCTDQVANLDIMVRQFMENNSGRVASRDDGDAQERQRQKAQLATELTTWNKVNTARKLWIIRGRIPPNLGDSPADLQSFVGEAIHVTASVASQLRSFSSFDVGAYGPRVDGPIGHSLMVADRLDLLRLAVVAILSVGLSPGVADDLPCLARVNALGDAFTVAVMGLRAHTFSNYSMLSVPEAHAVLCDMVNRDIALWVSELMRAAQRSSPAIVPPPAGTAFDPPPVPAFVRTLEFCRGGGEVLRLVLSSIGSGADRPTKRKATAPPAGSPGSKGKASSSLPQVCRMYARTGKCNWSPCKFLHEAPAASASSPSPPARREEGGGSVAAGGGSRALSLRPVLPAGGSRGGEGGRGAGSGSV